MEQIIIVQAALPSKPQEWRNTMTKRQRKELQRTRSKMILPENWERYLNEISMQDNYYARIVASALKDPKESHIPWFLTAVTALEYSRIHKGYVWKKHVRYLEGYGYPLHYEDIRSALSNYWRHNYTRYDHYLSLGYDKGTARRLSNAELKWQGLPESRTEDDNLDAA